tara:strand:+ start:446 stop:1120 length:675 start_codon:yes stop_codon:yes gene_type:complete
MMFYLVFDFETTGFKSKLNENQPIPENFPTQFACQLVTPLGNVIESYDTLIKGAVQLSQWSTKNCPHISIERCNNDGITIKDLLSNILNIIGDYNCTLVAHNIEYDWDRVLVAQAFAAGIQNSDEFRQLCKYDRLCTMVHETNRFWSCNHNKWCGPSLAKLALKNNIFFDSTQAHDAMYDVNITRQCLVEIIKNQSRTYKDRTHALKKRVNEPLTFKDKCIRVI